MKIADQLREALRLRHSSLRTERTYVGWYARYVKFHGLRHPAEMGTAEVTAFLTDLAAYRVVDTRLGRGLAGFPRRRPPPITIRGLKTAGGTLWAI